MMGEGNELETLRAQQMLELTTGWSKWKTPEDGLVSFVLEHMIFSHDHPDLTFLDGSSVSVMLGKGA